MHRQMEFGPQYVTFKKSYAKFPVKLSMDDSTHNNEQFGGCPLVDHSTHNNEQFGGCLIKIKQILNILQGF